MNNWSTRWSIKYRSWETSKRQPPNFSRKSSRTLRVSISKSFVGSSSTRKFGLLTRSFKSWSRFFSPPLSLSIKVYCFSGGNRKFSRNFEADSWLPSERVMNSAISLPLQCTVAGIQCHRILREVPKPGSGSRHYKTAVGLCLLGNNIQEC